MTSDFSHLKRPKEPMPDFVRQALEEHGLMEAYRERPAYQQNDYIRWINEARREETKAKRLRQMLDELRVGGVYMKMKHPPSARRRPAVTEDPEHIVNASDQQLTAILEKHDSKLREVFLTVHRLIKECLPDIRYATDCVNGGTGYGARQYGYDGWGVFALSAHNKWVSLYFMRGSDLDDPEGVLEGSGKKMRHIKFRSLQQLEERRGALQRLIQQAARLYDPV